MHDPSLSRHVRVTAVAVDALDGYRREGVRFLRLERSAAIDSAAVRRRGMSTLVDSLTGWRPSPDRRVTSTGVRAQPGLRHGDVVRVVKSSTRRWRLHRHGRFAMDRLSPMDA